MRKLLSIILILTLSLSVQAATIKESVDLISVMVPLNNQYGTLDAVSFDESKNELIAIYSCSDEFLESFNQSKEISLAAFLTGILMASNIDLAPFNLVIIVRTPSNPKGKTVYEPAAKMQQLISAVKEIMSKTDQNSMELFVSRIQEAPMQCDPDGAFCYTLDFSEKSNELVMNLQILDVTDTEEYAYAVDLLADNLGKELANSIKFFEPLMKANNIGVRIDMYQGTANAPFKIIKYSPQQLFN